MTSAMASLLILGSRPEPTLPPTTAYRDVACANGSGFSAALHGLPNPAFTVMSAILTTVSSGTQTLKALAGLRTRALYFFPRPPKGRRGLKRVLRQLAENLATRPARLKKALRDADYQYDEFIYHPHSYYDRLVKDLCDRDPGILGQIERKQPSTGTIVLALGMASGRYDSYILSGFSFELTHAYGQNPEIDERGTQKSRHADTDIAVMRYLSDKHRNIFTTETVVSERAGIPLLPPQRQTR